MPTMLDAFFFEIGWKTDKLKQGEDEIRSGSKRTQEAVDKDTKRMEASGRRSAESFRNLRNEVVGLFLAFTGASSIKQFVTNTMNADAATQRLAANIGVSGRELRAWQGIATAAGGAAADADNTFNGLVTTFTNWKRGGGISADVGTNLSRLGLGVQDLQDPVSAILKASQASNRMSRPDFLASMRAVGISDSLISAASEGRASLQAAYEQQYDLTKNFKASADAAIENQKAMSALTSTINDALRPAITEAAKGLTDFIKSVTGKDVPTPTAGPDSHRAGYELGLLLRGDMAGFWRATREDLGSLHDSAHPVPNGGYTNVGAGGGRGAVGAARPGEAMTSTQLEAIARGIPGAHSFGGGRSTARNRMVNGVEGSQHIDDQGHPATALDFGAPGMTVSDVERYFTSKGARVKVLWHNAGSGYHFHVQAAPGLRLPSNRPAPSNTSAAQRALLAAGVDPRFAAQIAAARTARAGGRTAASHTTNVTIGTINTQAKDAKGIADTLPSAIKRRGLTTQANSGLN